MLAARVGSPQTWGRWLVLSPQSHQVSPLSSISNCFWVTKSGPTADGAKIPIRLGFGNIGDVTGRYWGNPSIADSGNGQVMEW